jgi:hypothetical protein
VRHCGLFFQISESFDELSGIEKVNAFALIKGLETGGGF